MTWLWPNASVNVLPNQGEKKMMTKCSIQWLNIGSCFFRIDDFRAVDRRFEKDVCTIHLTNERTLICMVSVEEVIKAIQEAWIEQEETS